MAASRSGSIGGTAPDVLPKNTHVPRDCECVPIGRVRMQSTDLCYAIASYYRPGMHLDAVEREQVRGETDAIVDHIHPRAVGGFSDLTQHLRHTVLVQKHLICHTGEATALVTKWRAHELCITLARLSSIRTLYV